MEGSPDPLTRAPRAHGTRQQLCLAPPALQGALVALIGRDTRGVVLDDAQRLTHFPASPLLSLSWFDTTEVGLAEPGGRWRPFGARVMLAGSQSRPVTTWAPGNGYGGLAVFTADVARALFGLNPQALHDRFVAAHEVLPAASWPLLDALALAADDRAAHGVLHRHLAPRWQALQGRATAAPTLRQVGRHWVDRLAVQALAWRQMHSPRQVERRIKAASGRSLRQWRALVKTEGVFFAARERQEVGLPVDWAALAQQEGFADQAHLSREVRRITGFAPTLFADRFVADESFWLYRLWV